MADQDTMDDQDTQEDRFERFSLALGNRIYELIEVSFEIEEQTRSYRLCRTNKPDLYAHLLSLQKRLDGQQWDWMAGSWIRLQSFSIEKSGPVATSDLYSISAADGSILRSATKHGLAWSWLQIGSRHVINHIHDVLLGTEPREITWSGISIALADSSALLLDWIAEERQVVSQKNPDGPLPPNSFRWHGQQFVGLEPIPFNLLAYCWHSSERCGSYDGLADAVWGDSNKEFAGDPVNQAAQKLRNFFMKHQIPLTCSNSEKLRSVCIKDKSPEKS